MATPMKSTKIVLGSLMLVAIIVLTYQGSSFSADLASDQLVVIRDSGTTLTKPEVLTKENMTEIENTFMQRRSSLNKWCSKKRNVDFINYKYSKLILQGYDWMHIPEYKLFYCSIPKAGSTTMKDILMKSIGVQRNTAELHDQAADVISMDELRGRASPLNIPLARARRNPFYPEKQPSHSLIIVRNPWKRLVSSYQNKIKQNGHPLVNYCREYPPAKANYKQSSFNTTFSEFVNCVLSNYLLDLPFFDDHLFPMNKLCGICLIEYDMIVKLENFQSEMRHALSFIEGDTSQLKTHLLSKKERLNPTQHTDYLQYYRQLNTAQISLLKDLYRDDFAIFGYNMELNL